MGRSYRDDRDGVSAVMDLMASHQVTPDIVTFGSFALNCYKKHEIQQLLQSMDDFGYRPNHEILGALVSSCTHRVYLSTIIYVLSLYQKYELLPNERSIKKLEKFKELMKKNEKQIERGEKIMRGDQEIMTWFRTEEGMRRYQEY